MPNIVNSKPIVSVIVPTKNSALTLQKCLENIRQQTATKLEIIVVDNFSSDKTPEIAKRFADYLYQLGPERSAQRNFGVKKSKGEYVAIIDSDMYLTPTVINDCVKAMSKNNMAGVIVPEESIGEGFWAKCKSFERSFYVGVSYMEAARFFKKRDYLLAGGYNEKMVSGEDWDLSQRMSQSHPLGRVNSYIHHDEGHISLFKTIKKKYYYAKHFADYTNQTENQQNLKAQTSIISRYCLFFKQPLKLLRHPIISTGMLFMKTCEFFFGGAGLLVGRQNLK
jgi:glycosyltransferase involved in cell wall biosynthesis